MNTAIARLLRRAEEEEPARLAETFVDVNALFARLSSRDSQIIFGRRGTGKTHALKYLAETLRGHGDTVVFLDLRLLGSTGGIYTDSDVSIAEAGTRLVVDVLQGIYDALIEQALTGAAAESEAGDRLLMQLDRLGETLGDVEIVGEREERTAANASATREAEVGIQVPPLSAFGRVHEGKRLAAEREIVMRGVARHRVHFGSVGSALAKLIPSLPGKRLWLLMDEWSHVSMDLQPLLADLIRHCLLPVHGLTAKIAAIEKRTTFKLDRNDRSYIGIELGADVAADIDLDEFMVFTAGGDSATDFFKQLFHRHVQAASEQDQPLALDSPDDFLDQAFAGQGAFRELVRAAEGVPRDGINILSKAALHAADAPITLRHVRDAARSWYMSDKEATLRTRADERELLHWIIDRVIEQRKIRGFLLLQGSESHLIDWLYDARLIHLIKRGIAAKDRAGVRFDAYALDYGCYVDLLATRGAGPRGLFRTDDDDPVDVPADNLEDIRGAILDLDEFATSGASSTLGRREPPTVTLRGHARTGSLMVGSPTELRQEDVASDWQLLVEGREGIVVVPLNPRPMRIGSSSNDHIRIQDETVTPRHAVIELADDVPVLSADRSDKVYVNELKVGSQKVRHRDHVCVGDAELLVVHTATETASAE